MTFLGVYYWAFYIRKRRRPKTTPKKEFHGQNPHRKDLHLKRSESLSFAFAFVLQQSESAESILRDMATRPNAPPPPSRDTCRTTPVALCFLWYCRLSLLHLRSVKMAYCSPKTGLGGGGVYHVWRFCRETTHWFWHYKNNERFLKPLEVKLDIPSPCLDASREGLLLEFMA